MPLRFGNKFLAAIREVDALCEVVRHFPGTEVIHVEGSVDPKRDRETVEVELILADMESLEKRLEKTRNAARTGDKEKLKEVMVAEKILSALKAGKLSVVDAANQSQDWQLRDGFLQVANNKVIVLATLAG